MDLLLSFFPYGLAIIIFMSVVRLVLIYKEFNLSIFNFLDISEMTIHILNDLYGLTVFFFASMILILLKSPISKISSMAHIQWWLGILCGVIFAVVGCFYWRYKKYSFRTHFWVCVLIYIGLCMVAAFVKTFPSVDSKLLLLLIVLVFGFLYCKSLAKYVVYEIKVLKVTQGSVIKFKESKYPEIISNDSIYYIGNTTKFLFVYDETTARCTAYPMSDIISVTNY